MERMREFGTTIFAEMSALAVATGSINLGQGFPDTDGPEVVLDAAVDAIRSGRHNQYPPVWAYQSFGTRSRAISTGSTASPMTPRPKSS